MLGLATGPPPADFDQEAFASELAGLLATYRHVSLKELRLGPLQQLTEISVRHRLRLPSSLALIGKAFGQMRLAAELDPTLDPFTVAGSSYLRQLASSMRAAANPTQLFYESQKLRVRATRLLEGLERTLGVRGGTGLQVDFRGTRELTARDRTRRPPHRGRPGSSYRDRRGPFTGRAQAHISVYEVTAAPAG